MGILPPGKAMSHIPRKLFSEEDDENLKQAVKEIGEDKWAEVSERMKYFTPRQCKERYTIYLKKAYRTDPWSEEEDALLIELYDTLGPKWCEISEFFNGRHVNSVKNRWNRYIQNGTKKKIEKYEQECKLKIEKEKRKKEKAAARANPPPDFLPPQPLFTQQVQKVPVFTAQQIPTDFGTFMQQMQTMQVPTNAQMPPLIQKSQTQFEKTCEMQKPQRHDFEAPQAETKYEDMKFEFEFLYK